MNDRHYQDLDNKAFEELIGHTMLGDIDIRILENIANNESIDRHTRIVAAAIYRLEVSRWKKEMYEQEQNEHR